MKLLLLVFCGLATALAVRYDAYSVIDIHVKGDKSNYQLVQSLVDKDERLKQVISLSESKSVVTVAVSPLARSKLEVALKKRGIHYVVSDNNLQDSIEKTFEHNERAKHLYFNRFRSGNKAAPTAYLRYDDQVSWLQSAASSSSIASTFTIGTSWEGRTIWGISINDGNQALPAVWLDANIHAREWISSATALYIIDEILTGTSADAVELRNNYRFYIVPNSNPDGYEYTHTNDRLWRKTRSDHGTVCLGTDPNRNWDANFGGEGSSSSACSDTYHGPSAFSEPETAAMRDFLAGIASDCNVYVSLHCYSQLWLVPYGSYSTKPPDYNELMRVGNLAAAAVQSVNGRAFEVGTPPDILYVASGGSFDYTKETLNIEYSYTPELRPATSAAGGFEIPDTHITPSGQEIFAGFAVTVREATHKSRK